ncbi:hypothetical protein [Actinopolyspora mortivallis]|uniref:hypothetical protein n=1 Tax=Actinopolyspora mortivallis TaxID=33906 RepID=UPI00036F1A27|nr:hypothetical protein [Actinopolyspora mortivallis]
MGGVVAVWDGIESWLVMLPYPFQVTLVLAVLIPLCWLVARGLDRGVDELVARLTRTREADPPVRVGRRRVRVRTGTGLIVKGRRVEAE